MLVATAFSVEEDDDDIIVPKFDLLSVARVSRTHLALQLLNRPNTKHNSSTALSQLSTFGRRRAVYVAVFVSFTAITGHF